MQLQKLHTPFVLCIALIGSISFGLLRWYHYREIGMLIGVAFVAAVLLGIHPTTTPLAAEGEQVVLYGKVYSYTVGTYGDRLVLEHVRLEDGTRYRAKVQCELQSGMRSEVGYEVCLKGRIEKMPTQMNPSDMDYSTYLKSQGISTVLRCTQLQQKKGQLPMHEKLRDCFATQIKAVFEGDTKGMMQTLLLGCDTSLDSIVETAYYQVGVGHVLAISGLHIGVIFATMWWGLGWLKVPYRLRIVACLVMVWLYTWLVGSSVSAVRACILLTTTYGGRALDQEEDIWTSIALAMLIILMANPYQLFQAGFQLSFGAYIGVAISAYVVQHRKRIGKALSGGLMLIGGNLFLSLWISPILAWHFFEVPVLGSLLNLVVIPFYSLLVPVGIVLVLLSFFVPGLAAFCGHLVVVLLEGCNEVIGWVATWPYASCIIGRPSIGQCVMWYAIILVSVVAVCRLSCKLWQLVGVVVMTLAVRSVWFQTTTLTITHLYVGQGDSAVIITPQQQVIVIDGGGYGKEQVVWRYLKYRGYDAIDYAIVSHPHEDHVGGIVGLIEQEVPIQTVITTCVDPESEWETKLQKACVQKDTLHYVVEGWECLVEEGVSVQLMQHTQPLEDENDASIVCLLAYGQYTQLFTGDMTEKVEGLYTPYVPQLAVLKVAHHGSKTSTGDKFLEHTTPKYGIISCGINNRYQHPHSEVCDRLQRIGAHVLRTDRQGAITIQTDGSVCAVRAHIQED